jgi:two-component system, OmpR family, response regulator MtrA
MLTATGRSAITQMTVMAAEGRCDSGDAEPSNSPGPSRTAQKRLLVVDDQVSLTKIVGTIAASMGLDVRVVNDPHKALDAFLEYRPDILLLDMIMPEKDGVDVLHEILLTGIDTAIIVTSGFTASYSQLAAGVAKFHDKGPVRMLRKPFRRDQLIALLRETLGQAE